METPLALLIGLLAAVATWLMLSRNLIRLLLGFAMLGNAVNLLIFDGPQVLDDAWCARLNTGRRDAGTGMISTRS